MDCLCKLGYGEVVGDSFGSVKLIWVKFRVLYNYGSIILWLCYFIIIFVLNCNKRIKLFVYICSLYLYILM